MKVKVIELEETEMLDPEEQAEVNSIFRRWLDYSPKDINLWKELPDWKIIVEDIKFLLGILTPLRSRWQQEMNRVYELAHEKGYEKGLKEAQESQERWP